MKVSEGTKTSSFFFTPMALREINNAWVQFIKATEYFAFVIFSLEFSSNFHSKLNGILKIFPLEINKFSSPELNQITEIPFNLDYRAGYFSLASFLCYCLFAETLIDKEESEIEKFSVSLLSLKKTILSPSALE